MQFILFTLLPFLVTCTRELQRPASKKPINLIKHVLRASAEKKMRYPFYKELEWSRRLAQPEINIRQEIARAEETIINALYRNHFATIGFLLNQNIHLTQKQIKRIEAVIDEMIPLQSSARDYKMLESFKEQIFAGEYQAQYINTLVNPVGELEHNDDRNTFQKEKLFAQEIADLPNLRHVKRTPLSILQDYGHTLLGMAISRSNVGIVEYLIQEANIKLDEDGGEIFQNFHMNVGSISRQIADILLSSKRIKLERVIRSSILNRKSGFLVHMLDRSEFGKYRHIHFSQTHLALDAAILAKELYETAQISYSLRLGTLTENDIQIAFEIASEIRNKQLAVGLENIADLVLTKEEAALFDQQQQRQLQNNILLLTAEILRSQHEHAMYYSMSRDDISYVLGGLQWLLDTDFITKDEMIAAITATQAPQLLEHVLHHRPRRTDIMTAMVTAGVTSRSMMLEVLEIKRRLGFSSMWHNTDGLPYDKNTMHMDIEVTDQLLDSMAMAAALGHLSWVTTELSSHAFDNEVYVYLILDAVRFHGGDVAQLSLLNEVERGIRMHIVGLFREGGHSHRFLDWFDTTEVNNPTEKDIVPSVEVSIFPYHIGYLTDIFWTTLNCCGLQ